MGCVGTPFMYKKTLCAFTSAVMMSSTEDDAFFAFGLKSSCESEEEENPPVSRAVGNVPDEAPPLTRTPASPVLSAPDEYNT